MYLTLFLFFFTFFVGIVYLFFNQLAKLMKQNEKIFLLQKKYLENLEDIHASLKKD